MQILVYGRCYKKVKCGRVLLNETYKFYVVEVYNAVDSQEGWAIYCDKQDMHICDGE